MAADQDLDRNEKATPHKLQQARSKGQVAKSQDVTTVVILLVAVAWLSAQGWDGLRHLFQFDRLILSQAASAAAVSPLGVLDVASSDALAMLAPFLGAVVLAAIVANLAQTGPVFTFHPLKPDFDRLNPATGFKRVFSMRSLFDLLRSLLKLGILGATAWIALHAMLGQFHHVAGLSTLGQVQLMVKDAASLGMKLVLALAVIAAVDLWYTRRSFDNKMRMSRRELKEEHRHREGDPRIRARLRELRRAMLKKASSVRRTQDADLLITNPTHYAIALQYTHGEMPAPRLIGKGVGATAAAMRLVAQRHQIPIVQNRTLARALYACMETDQYVPAEHYAQVARLMIWVLARRGPRPAKKRDDAPTVAARGRLLARLRERDRARSRAQAASTPARSTSAAPKASR